MKTIKRRWSSNTPEFFKRIINAAIVVGVIGGALITLPATAAVGAVLVTIGATAATISKLTKI